MSRFFDRRAPENGRMAGAPSDVTDPRIIDAMPGAARGICAAEQAGAGLSGYTISTSATAARRTLPDQARGNGEKLLQAADIKDTDNVLVVGLRDRICGGRRASLAGRVTATEVDPTMSPGQKSSGPARNWKCAVRPPIRPRGTRPNALMM